MTKETPKQRGKYFRSGNTLMRNNEDGTFSSSYIAEFYDADIPELDEMIAKLNTHANLMEACKKSLSIFKQLAEEGKYPEMLLAENGGEGFLFLEAAIAKGAQP